MVDTQKTEDPVRKYSRRAESYCTHHCRVCGGHFSSLRAFDAHRRGEFEPQGDEQSRHCVDLEEMPEKAARNFEYREGICGLAMPGTELQHVLVLGGAGSQPKGIHV